MISLIKQNAGKTALIVLLFLWIGSLLAQPAPIELVKEFGLFSVLGVIGAIFANATGAGGGVVFVPFFNYLSFSAQSVVATSFAIQCCGMTAATMHRGIACGSCSSQKHATMVSWRNVL